MGSQYSFLFHFKLEKNYSKSLFYSPDLPGSVTQLAAMATAQEYPMTASSTVARLLVLFFFRPRISSQRWWRIVVAASAASLVWEFPRDVWRFS